MTLYVLLPFFAFADAGHIFGVGRISRSDLSVIDWSNDQTAQPTVETWTRILWMEQQINVVDAKTHCCASMWPKVTSDTDPAPMD